MALSLRCQCGQVRGTVEPARAYVRATCYCRDCQAYARYLGRPGLTDAQGGTDTVAMNPQAVRITTGIDQVECMSLSAKGILRWYAACCLTPLGNTPREPGIAYVGIPTPALGPAATLDAALGPAGRTVINGGSARGKVSATPLGFVVGGLRILVGLAAARLRRQRPSLFFGPEGAPLRTPRVLDAAQRAPLYGDAGTRAPQGGI